MTPPKPEPMGPHCGCRLCCEAGAVPGERPTPKRAATPAHTDDVTRCDDDTPDLFTGVDDHGE